MSLEFKIFLAIMSLVLIVTAISHIAHVLSYDNIRNTARTLPAFNQVNLVFGKLGETDCYMTKDKYSCKTLVVELPTEHNTIVATNDFIDETKNMGIEWPEQKNSQSYIYSSTFTNADNTYHIHISADQNVTTVMLVEH